MKKKHTLIFGLSADPVHQAHSDLVVKVIHALTDLSYSIKNTLIIPVFRRNPVGSKRKDDLPGSFEHRYEMCKLAVVEITNHLRTINVPVIVSRIEEKLVKLNNQPNYAVQTLSALQENEAKDTNMIFLFSSDIVSGENPELRYWYQLEKLIKLTIFAICPRPGYQRNEIFVQSCQKDGARFIFLDEIESEDIAASNIKERLHKGEDPLLLSTQGLLQESVARYIKKNNLYKL